MVVGCPWCRFCEEKNQSWQGVVQHVQYQDIPKISKHRMNNSTWYVLCVCLCACMCQRHARSQRLCHIITSLYFWNSLGRDKFFSLQGANGLQHATTDETSKARPCSFWCWQWKLLRHFNFLASIYLGNKIVITIFIYIYTLINVFEHIFTV